MSPAAAQALRTTFDGLTRTLGNLAQPEKPRVHKCESRFFFDPVFQERRRMHRVLVDGEIYHVRDHELHALEDGITPEELCLDPVEDEERL